MCGRFGLYAPIDVIEGRYGRDVVADFEPRYNIAPESDPILVAPNDTSTIDAMSWGLRPHWVDEPDDWPHPINARAETLTDKPSFRAAFESRRCLIPATGFFEWSGRRGARRPHWITFEQDLVSMAGLWETWSANGETVTSVVVITTTANDAIADLHDRMPVILRPNDESAWIEETDPDRLRALLAPYPSDRTSAHAVSSAVNDPSASGPALIEPLDGTQSDLGDYPA